MANQVCRSSQGLWKEKWSTTCLQHEVAKEIYICLSQMESFRVDEKFFMVCVLSQRQTLSLPGGQPAERKCKQSLPSLFCATNGWKTTFAFIT